MALVGAVGAVYVQTDAAPVAFTDQATTANADYTRYQVTDPAYRYWPLDAAITVKKNGAVITTGFALERAGGFVVFDAPLLETDTVTVSGTALTVAQAGGFFNWSLEPDQEVKDVTTFASGGWKEFAATLKDWSGSAEAYWGDDRFFKALGQILVVKLYVDSGPSQACFEGFAVISGDGAKGSTDTVVQETINFTGVGPLYPRF